MALVPQTPALLPQIQNAETVLLTGSFILTRQFAWHFCREEGMKLGIHQDLNMHQPLDYNRATETELTQVCWCCQGPCSLAQGSGQGQCSVRQSLRMCPSTDQTQAETSLDRRRQCNSFKGHLNSVLCLKQGKMGLMAIRGIKCKNSPCPCHCHCWERRFTVNEILLWDALM